MGSIKMAYMTDDDISSDGRIPEGLGAGIIPTAINAVIKGPTALCGTGRSLYEAIVIAGQFTISGQPTGRSGREVLTLINGIGGYAKTNWLRARCT